VGAPTRTAPTARWSRVGQGGPPRPASSPPVSVRKDRRWREHPDRSARKGDAVKVSPQGRRAQVFVAPHDAMPSARISVRTGDAAGRTGHPSRRTARRPTAAPSGASTGRRLRASAHGWLGRVFQGEAKAMRGANPGPPDPDTPTGTDREGQPFRESGRAKVMAGCGKGQRPASSSACATDPHGHPAHVPEGQPTPEGRDGTNPQGEPAAAPTMSRNTL
jgi:hypothetical protein